MADLNTDIRYIKGVGEARAKAFEKLGVFTLGDLIAYYPRRWEDRSQLYPIRDLPEGEYACCKAMIAPSTMPISKVSTKPAILSERHALNQFTPSTKTLSSVK